jgi:hypothetical protein
VTSILAAANTLKHRAPSRSHASRHASRVWYSAVAQRRTSRPSDTVLNAADIAVGRLSLKLRLARRAACNSKRNLTTGKLLGGVGSPMVR